MTTLILRRARLLDLDHDGSIGDVVVAGGRVVAAGPDAGAAYPSAETVDLGGDILIPGLVNAHTHSNQSIEKGLCDALPLDAWMVVASYGGAGARLSPRDLYVSAMVGGLEMIRTGTTSVLDCARADLEWIDEGMDAIMQAYLDLGMRASVAIQFSDLDFFSSIPVELVPGGSALVRPPLARPDQVLASADRFLDRWEKRSERVRPLLGPSSLPRCSTELFGAAVDLARSRGARMQTHLLSARSQIDVARTRFGGSTVAFLRDMGALEDWASFAHAIWLDEREQMMFAESEAVAVHNPASNLKLGAGVAPVPGLLRAGARVAIGSDGASSNDTQNMFETLKLATLIHRVQGPPATWPTAADGLTMCWRGGARALGADVGRIAAGALADFTVLDADQVWPAPAAQLRNQIAYGELGSAVRSVYVDGLPVLLDRRVTTVDEAAIRAEARELTTRIWSSLPDRLARFEELRPMLERIEAAAGLRSDPSCG
ncbi:amidohydrolase family protein [Rhizohabitans arisaemae]|uniref:amidohydrolase family protein n=1 Tax=Rhizohabitans arisaemae TaxID=2720610 RepID=UPI0024B18D1F|nr:amidohydrolase family protein [Rhizohabitans arisaemae]